MFRSKQLAVVLLVPVMLTGCQGLHRSAKLTTAHAESLQLLGFQIPSSAQDRLDGMVPKDAELVTAAAAPEDLNSLLGFLNRIWGIGYAAATWKNEK